MLVVKRVMRMVSVMVMVGLERKRWVGVVVGELRYPPLCMDGGGCFLDMVLIWTKAKRKKEKEKSVAKKSWRGRGSMWDGCGWVLFTN